MFAKDQDISGPRFVHRSDWPGDYRCKICTLPPERTFDELVAHYNGIHGYQIMGYKLDGVRFLEVDESGNFSERAKALVVGETQDIRNVF